MGFELDAILNEIDAEIDKKHLLKHDFYQAWPRGELSIECLQEYAKDYYSHVDAFPGYLSSIHSRLGNNRSRNGEDAKTRRILLQNLIEEEAGSPNHPELWKNFAMALGVSEGDLSQHSPSKEMQNLVDTFRSICRQNSIVEGIAILYAYEKQIPDICLSKIEGLKKFYGMQNPKSWEYFHVHIEADQEHAAQERTLIRKYLQPENRQQVITSVNQALDALWNFLSGLCKKFSISCHPACDYS